MKQPGVSEKDIAAQLESRKIDWTDSCDDSHIENAVIELLEVWVMCKVHCMAWHLLIPVFLSTSSTKLILRVVAGGKGEKEASRNGIQVREHWMFSTGIRGGDQRRGYCEAISV